MALSPSDQRHWEQEQPVLENARKAHPELFESIQKKPGTLMRRVGILTTQTGKPKGYIKYYPFDFIVEEIRPNKNVITVDGKSVAAEFDDGHGTIYVDLTKVGISTLDAVQRIADALKIQRKHVGYAGIKDSVALTAQRISIRTAARDVVQSLSIPNCLLRNIIERKGAINVGNLFGNRFTLFVRTEKPVHPIEFEKQIAYIKQNGIMNYYGIQRFGSPRFLSHLFGMFLLRGDYKGCVEVFLTKESEFDLPFYHQKRRDASSHFGNWSKMRDIFSVLPHSFRFELQMLNQLLQQPDDFLAAINAVGDQASMWAKAYASYLTNLLLSESQQKSQSLPSVIPLLLGLDVDSASIYAPWLSVHEVKDYQKVMSKLKFLQVGNAPSIEPILKPEFHRYKIFDEGVVISFDLQKGAYATTVLESLFEIVTEQSLPKWVWTGTIDTKQTLGTGDLGEILDLLGDSISNLMKSKTENE
jgi:TruD family tRNA pseudouridine synthase